MEKLFGNKKIWIFSLFSLVLIALMRVQEYILIKEGKYTEEEARRNIVIEDMMKRMRDMSGLD